VNRTGDAIQWRPVVGYEGLYEVSVPRLKWFAGEPICLGIGTTVFLTSKITRDLRSRSISVPSDSNGPSAENSYYTIEFDISAKTT
jgi:hypothetical protein